MNVQPSLVRRFRRELTKFFADKTGSERQPLASVVRKLCLSLAGAATLLATQTATAQHPYSQEMGSYPPPQEYGAYCPPAAQGGAYAELLPHDRGFCYSDNIFEMPVFDALRDSWIRVEYMNGTILHKNGRALGAPILSTDGNVIRNVDQQFGVLFADELTTGQAIVPTTEDTDWDDLDGIRVSFGVPISDNSWLELSTWGLEEQESTLNTPNIPPSDLTPVNGVEPIQFIATTLTTDGQPGNRIILYDADFNSQYNVNLYTTEINFVQDLRIPHDGWKLQSLLGYRHEEYSEFLSFGGTFDNSSGVATDGTFITGPLTQPQSNNITSKVHNFRYSLQLGFRSELENRFFTLGVEPKVALGANLFRSRVTTRNVREPGDLSAFVPVDDLGIVDPNDLFDSTENQGVDLGGVPDPMGTVDPNLIVDDPVFTSDSDREIGFAPTFDLGIYAKIPVSDWFKLKVGYNLILIGQVSTADNNIRFNEVSADDPTLAPPTADVGLNRTLRHRIVDAFTIGGEITLP